MVSSILSLRIIGGHLKEGAQVTGLGGFISLLYNTPYIMYYYKTTTLTTRNNRPHRHANQHARKRHLPLHLRPLPRHRERKLPPAINPNPTPSPRSPSSSAAHSSAMTYHILSTCTDHYTKPQWRDGIPQGWLARDHPAWFRSTQRLKQLERTTKGVVVPGHDKELFENLIAKGTSYT